MNDLRYPIGPYKESLPSDASARLKLLSELVDAPNQLQAAVADLSESQLDMSYRPGGWTVKQVVHHLADAHMNWYIRTKFALTEESPVIQPYDEARWAELNDARTAPLGQSLMLMDGLTQRWVRLLRSLSEQEWKCKIVHPERGVMTLDAILPLITWHAKHHIAHIVSLRTRI